MFPASRLTRKASFGHFFASWRPATVRRGPSILVQYCRTDTSREWLDTTRTTRTGRETMAYGLYRSWINGDMHIISNTALQPRRYDPYQSYNSYGSWNNGLRVVQLVKCISLEKLTVYIQVHDSYDSWNNGSRTSQLMNCIDIYILIISNSAELIPPVNGWRDKHAKDNACSSLWKRECPQAQTTTNILRSQSVRALKRLNTYTVLFRVPKQERLNALLRMYVPRSKIINAPKHKTQWILFVLKAWEPKNALYNLLIRTVNQEISAPRTMRALRTRSEKGNAPTRKAQWIFFVLKTWEPINAIYIYTVLFGVLKQENLLKGYLECNPLSKSVNGQKHKTLFSKRDSPRGLYICVTRFHIAWLCKYFCHCKCFCHSFRITSLETISYSNQINPQC